MVGHVLEAQYSSGCWNYNRFLRVDLEQLDINLDSEW